MFGWFQRRKQEQAKVTRAYETGQRMAEQFDVDLERLIARFELHFDHAIDLLQKELNRSLELADDEWRAANPKLSAKYPREKSSI